MKKVKNSSPAQLATQLAFKRASSFLAPLRGLVKIGYFESAKQNDMMAIAMAMSQVLRCAVAGEYPDLYIAPADVILSKGPLSPVSLRTLQRTVDCITIRYGGHSGVIRGFTDDEVIACAYQVDKGVAVLNKQPATRGDEVVTINIPVELQQQPLYVYLLVCDRNRKKFSRSTYLGHV